MFFVCLFRVIVCSSLIQIITTKKYILQSFIHMHVLLSRQRWVNTKNTHFLRGCLGGGVLAKKEENYVTVSKVLFTNIGKVIA